jgi:tetratricopeptide (TPR) repeat protein
LAEDPDDAEALRDLGLALLQRVRETADPTLYLQAEEALGRARTLDPEDPMVLVGIGALQLARHDFSEALDTAHEALTLRPALAPAKAIEVDALVELGRYEDAVDAGQELLAFGIDQPSLARASYLRELHGNLEGALAAMEQAADLPALAPENTAYVTTIEGNLLALVGRRDEARDAYERALELVPDHAPALTGLGRLAVGDGDLETAIEWFERAATIAPLPEYVVALGEAQEAAGDASGAEESYALVRFETELFEANGVDVDLESALFEADHGDPSTALRLAQDAYDDRQTIRTADALAWAWHRVGDGAEAERLSDEALRLGTQDPLLLYHAGMIASVAGDPSEAVELLEDALGLDPGFSATGAAAARAELATLESR